MPDTTRQAVHPHHDELKNADGSWKYTNRLAGEASPYLLQHAHNPVDWYPWGEAAFEAARRQDKPIFLSIGYSTCYWCHVMERQVFENPVIAEQMNALFVNVKVDREERPDVDDLYMTATQMMTGRGGWPMSVFLTPPGAGEDGRGLEPFWAGTYIPPEPAHGMPGFPQVLEALSRAWKEQREGVIEQADRVATAVREHVQQRDLAAPVSLEQVQDTASQILRTYDAKHGGFGEAPKFPQPSNLQFLLAVYRNTGDDEIWNALSHTLSRMARGGMYDQVGGGFHRYSVDARWLVPHFEKMLYDNAQLVELYADATDVEGKDGAARLYRRIIAETCDYVLREMTDATGAFWSAQDAEVNAREGQNYLWTPEQVEAALNDDRLTKLTMQMYGLDRGTNFRDPHHPEDPPANVLYLPRPLDAVAEDVGENLDTLLDTRTRINEKLKAVRDQRDQPGTDDKVLASWNGLMIAALARAGQVLDEPRYLDAARRAAEAILSHMSDGEDGLYHTMREGSAKVPGFLEDYAFFTHGLIALHRAGVGEGRYLDAAQRYTQAALERFAAEAGGYDDTLPDQADLFVRVRSLYDGALPSGNSQMVHNLLDLHELTGEDRYLDRAARDLRGVGQALRRQGPAMAHMAHALLRAVERDPQRFPVEGVDLTHHEGLLDVRVDPQQVQLAEEPVTVEVTLKIEPGFHLNAGEPGEADVIPTRIDLRSGHGLSMQVEYPEGEPRRFPFADAPLSIYEGEVVLRVTLRRQGARPERAEAARLVLRYQPCTETACMSPQTLELPVRIEGGR